MLRQIISALPQKKLNPPSSSEEPTLQTFKRRARPNVRQRRTARRHQPGTCVNKAGPGVHQSLHATQGVLKKRNRPNARQRTTMQLAFLSRTWLFVHLKEWLFAWLPSGFRFERSVANTRSVRYDFSWPVGLDGYERSIGAVEGPLEDRRKDFWEYVGFKLLTS